MYRCAFDRASRDYRPGLLSREIGRRGRADCWHPDRNGQDTPFLCAAETVRNTQTQRRGSRLAMTEHSEHEGIAALTPFYVAGALSTAEAARFEAALAGDPDLARNVAAARAERDEVLALNEALPAPSPRAL